MYVRAVLVVLVIGGSLAPMPGALVERLYSEMLYPPMQSGLTGLSDLVPFALVDGLIVGAVHADEIVVLEAGTIVERGTHASLLRQNGRYAALWEAQQQGLVAA